jgi:hypothetical protein
MPTPAPQKILEIQHKNPAPPTNTDWAKNRGLWPNHSDLGFEWVQVVAPLEEYDQFSLVGASGWVINPPVPGENAEDVFDSAADIPFDHPFQFDWEFQVALDDDQNDYASLLSPANGAKKEEGDINTAKDLGLTVPANGLLGVEWEKGLLPQSFRSQVKHGDRTAVFGRWILDEGHDVEGNYRTEIHPPLLLVTASVQQSAQEPAFTRVLFMSRPYLVGQTFCVDPKNAYIDGTDDDGSFWDHLLKECIKVIGPPVLNIVGIGESSYAAGPTATCTR